MDSSTDEELLDINQPVTAEEAPLLPRKVLPPNSREKYQKAYKDFIQWKTAKKAKSFSENVLLVYFNHLSKTKRPSTLWCEYSKLKTTLCLKENVNIGDYTKLISFLKRKSEGFTPKKSKILSGNNIATFINEAPDEQHLLEKVILIFGVNGACRSNELSALTINDIETYSDKMIVHVRCAKSRDRMFIIQGEQLKVVQKYQQLRPVGIESDRFFLSFRNGECTQQPVGRHKIAAIPQLIATYLNLPDAESYTGHCLRRSSVSLLADTGADLITLKRHGGWLSNRAAESYIKESIGNQSKITTQIHEAILRTLPESQPSKSEVPLEEFSPFTPEASSLKVSSPEPRPSKYEVPFEEFDPFTPEACSLKVTSPEPRPSKYEVPFEEFDSFTPEASSSKEHSSKNFEVNLRGNTVHISLSNITNCHVSFNFN